MAQGGKVTVVTTLAKLIEKLGGYEVPSCLPKEIFLADQLKLNGLKREFTGPEKEFNSFFAANKEKVNIPFEDLYVVEVSRNNHLLFNGVSAVVMAAAANEDHGGRGRLIRPQTLAEALQIQKDLAEKRAQVEMEEAKRLEAYASINLADLKSSPWLPLSRIADMSVQDVLQHLLAGNVSDGQIEGFMARYPQFELDYHKRFDGEKFRFNEHLEAVKSYYGRYEFRKKPHLEVVVVEVFHEDLGYFYLPMIAGKADMQAVLEKLQKEVFPKYNPRDDEGRLMGERKLYYTKGFFHAFVPAVLNAKWRWLNRDKRADARAMVAAAKENGTFKDALALIREEMRRQEEADAAGGTRR